MTASHDTVDPSMKASRKTYTEVSTDLYLLPALVHLEGLEPSRAPLVDHHQARVVAVPR